MAHELRGRERSWLRRREELLDAVMEAGQSRFRAVVVTSLTTIAGLLPLLTERSAQAQSLKPLAISISCGLMLATVLTLLVVPAMYLVLDDMKRFALWVWRGEDTPPCLATLLVTED